MLTLLLIRSYEMIQAGQPVPGRPFVCPELEEMQRYSAVVQ